MYNRFRNKTNNIDKNIERLIKELKEENRTLKQELTNLYEKNKKDNEIKGAFDLILKIGIIFIFVFVTIVFIGMIVYTWTNNSGTIQNKIVLTVDISLVIIVLVMMIIQLCKEKNRNYIMSCVTIIIALIALFVALSKQGI